MTALDYVLGSIQLLLGIALTGVVLFQHGRSAGISGAIAGGAETFFGKSKAKTIDAILRRWTGVLAALFIIMTIVLIVLNRA